MSTLSNQHINNQIINYPYNYSDRQDCRVIIEVMDKGHSRRRFAGTYAIAVPYNRFSQTLRSIQCTGGKVCHVSISQLQLDREQTAAAETVVEIINESINFSSSENVSETEPIAEKAVDSEAFEDHFEDHVVVASIDEDHIVASTSVAKVENIELVAADSNIPENIADNIPDESCIASSPNSEPIIEVFEEQAIDVVVNMEILPSPSPSKAKKTKTATKTAAGGFNKPKNDKTTTKSPRKP